MKAFGAGIVALLILSGGCTETTGLGPANEAYSLTRVGQEVLPARVGSQTWFADTIRFGLRRRWTRTQVVLRHTEGATADPVRHEAAGYVTGQGNRIVLDFYCPPNALCVAPDTLHFSGTDLVRRENRYGEPVDPGPEFRYSRIR